MTPEEEPEWPIDPRDVHALRERLIMQLLGTGVSAWEAPVLARELERYVLAGVVVSPYDGEAAGVEGERRVDGTAAAPPVQAADGLVQTERDLLDGATLDPNRSRLSQSPAFIGGVGTPMIAEGRGAVQTLPDPEGA